jgi:hypothetical protein
MSNPLHGDPNALRGVASEFANKIVHFGSKGAWPIESVIPRQQKLIGVGPRTTLNQVKTKMTLYAPLLRLCRGRTLPGRAAVGGDVSHF